MSFGTVVHYVGSFLLFVATILTIIVDVSAPVADNISFIKLNLDNNADARFGVFGYCSKAKNGDWQCSKKQIGYDPADVMEDIHGGDWSSVRSTSMKALTRVLVLHPVGSVVTFIAFLLSLPASSAILSVMAMLAAAAAFVINIIAVIVDFVLFSLLGGKINDRDIGDAKYGPAIWIALVAMVFTFVATVFMLFTCCSGRSQKKKERKMMEHQGY